MVLKQSTQETGSKPKLENMSEEEQLAAVLQMSAKKEQAEMTEEEQLEAAMRLSKEAFELQQTEEKMEVNDTDGDVRMNAVKSEQDPDHQPDDDEARIASPMNDTLPFVKVEEDSAKISDSQNKINSESKAQQDTMHDIRNHIQHYNHSSDFVVTNSNVKHEIADQNHIQNSMSDIDKSEQ